jgi:hypothetical protein
MYFGAKDTAEILQLDYITVRTLLKDKVIGSVHTSKRWWVSDVDIERYVGDSDKARRFIDLWFYIKLKNGEKIKKCYLPYCKARGILKIIENEVN